MDEEKSSPQRLDEGQSAEVDQPTQTLETIPEGVEDQSVEDADAGSMASSYLQHEDKSWQKYIDQINEDLTKIVEPEEPQEEDEGQRMPLSLLTCSPDDLYVGDPVEVSAAEYAELAIYPPRTNTVGLERQPEPGEIVLLQMGQHTAQFACGPKSLQMDQVVCKRSNVGRRAGGTRAGGQGLRHRSVEADARGDFSKTDGNS